MSKRTYVSKEPIRYGEHDGHRYPIYEIRDGVEITAPIFPEHYIDITPRRMFKFFLRHPWRYITVLEEVQRTGRYGDFLKIYATKYPRDLC